VVPRAISHHKWYKQKFQEYPKERKAILPFLW
jgi:3-oxo-5-alpha-steroid 4-dehydrogenase 1